MFCLQLRTAWRLSTAFACLFAWGSPIAHAAETVESILEDQRINGYASKSQALTRLQTATDKPSATAPVAARYRYYAGLAYLAADAEQAEPLRIARTQLDFMAQHLDCQPCEIEVELLDAEFAIRRKQAVKTNAILARLPPGSVMEMRQAQRFALVRAQLADMQEKTADAVKYAIQAENLAHKTGNVRAQINAMIVQSVINIRRDDFDRAAALAEGAFTLAQRFGMKDRQGAIRLNQAYMHAMQGQSNESYKYLMQVIEIANNDPGLSQLRLTALGNLAAYFLEMGRFEEGLDYSRRAVQLARQLGHPSLEIVGLNNWGSAEIQLGDVEVGLQRMRDALALAQRMGMHLEVMQSHMQISWAYYDLGRYREAYEELRKSRKLFNQVSRIDHNQAILEVQEEQSAELKNREIQRLSLVNARRQAELNARLYKQRLWAMVAITFLLLAALLYQGLRGLRQRNKALEISNVSLSEQSNHDPLTGAFNRRHCEQVLNHEASLLEQAPADTVPQTCVGFILFDLDHFKRINDTAGHAAGDAVLIEVTRRLQNSLRVRDVVARWGGEEFLLMLPGTPALHLPIIANNVLQSIGGQLFDTLAGPVAVTGSIGAIGWPMYPGQSWTEALHATDLALYASKKGGRNRAACITALAADVSVDRVQQILNDGGEAAGFAVETRTGPATPPRN